MRQVLLSLVLCAAWPMLAAAQDFGFEPPESASDPMLPAAMRDLAERVLPVYQEDDRDRYLANLAALQIVAGRPAAADATRRSLRELRQAEQRDERASRSVVYDIYTRARALEVERGGFSFPSAYAEAFRDTLAGLSNLEAYQLEDWLLAPIEPLETDLQHALDQRREKTSIMLEEALDLVRAWFAVQSYRRFRGIVQPFVAEENQRRYIIENDVSIPVADDATVAATIVRPRPGVSDAALPALLEFTLDRSSRDPREAAAHGYASVLTTARIAGDPMFRPRAPFETDGDDARAVIDWIAAQAWSDGRVGLQGAGYGGFVAWSAAKEPPAALAAIATNDPMAPGIDVPMANRIAQNSAYHWVYGLLAAPDDELARDDAQWRAFDEDWYRSGRRYRDFPSLPGPASAVFRRWLNHPSYDRFWQQWLPFGEEFAAVDIPVLTVTGYYSARETAALYYFTEHHEHDPDAAHALLIGPFDERGAERGVSFSLRGLPLDPVAAIDPSDVRYAWFDHVLGGKERPPLLTANVNYEVAGTNEWRHAPSLAALEAQPLRFYLEAAPEGARHALVTELPAAPADLTDSVDLADRTDAEWRPPQDLILTELMPRAALLFETQPLDAAVNLAGRLSGVLDLTINKFDVDLVMMLYELRPDGEYVKLFEPAYAFRASYAGDRVRRRLLVNGVRQLLPFQSERMVGRRLEAGSRLVLTLGVNKRADQQINYGAGGEVSEESIEDAGAPVTIRWHEGSFIEIPSQP